jgi:hypothetical protein
VRPSVGRIVHYVSYGTPGGEYKSECRAAVVTEVGGLIGTHATIEHGSDEQALGLCVLNPSGLFFNQGVIYHEGDIGHYHAGQEILARSYPGGTWHWPEREPG